MRRRNRKQTIIILNISNTDAMLPDISAATGISATSLFQKGLPTNPGKPHLAWFSSWRMAREIDDVGRLSDEVTDLSATFVSMKKDLPDLPPDSTTELWIVNYGRPKPYVISLEAARAVASAGLRISFEFYW